MKQIYKSSKECKNAAVWTAKGEALSNYLNEVKGAVRQDRLLKMKSEPSVITDDDVSGHVEVSAEDQEANKDLITVAREQRAQNASKRRSQFVYSLTAIENCDC